MIIPSIDIQNGQTVQLIGGEKLAIEAGDPMAIAAKFSLAGEIALIDLDAAMNKPSNEELLSRVVQTYPCRVGGGIRTVERAIFWLDKGARSVIIGTAATPEFLSQLPKERVIAAVDARHGKVVTEGWTKDTGLDMLEQIKALKEFVSGFLVTFVEREGQMTGIDLVRAKELVEAAAPAKVTIAGGIKTAQEIAELDKIGADAQVGMALYTGAFSLAEAFCAPLTSDRPDGLWPTVVVDEFGAALGLCWSNAESLTHAFNTSSGTYWSRKRGLWEKGASSGNTQELIRVDVDCDRDALRFIVRQKGTGFCHTGTYSCWGSSWGFSNLYQVLEQRKENAPTGSYTKRLYEEPGLLEKKLVEEAMELGEAIEPHDIIHETADVVFFALTKAAKHGTKLSDITKELDRRSRKVTRRPGNAKW